MYTQDIFRILKIVFSVFILKGHMSDIEIYDNAKESRYLVSKSKQDLILNKGHISKLENIEKTFGNSQVTLVHDANKVAIKETSGKKVFYLLKVNIVGLETSIIKILELHERNPENQHEFIFKILELIAYEINNMNNISNSLYTLSRKRINLNNEVNSPLAHLSTKQKEILQLKQEIEGQEKLLIQEFEFAEHQQKVVNLLLENMKTLIKSMYQENFPSRVLQGLGILENSNTNLISSLKKYADKVSH